MPDRYNRYVERPHCRRRRGPHLAGIAACAPRPPITASISGPTGGRWDMFLTAYEGDRWRRRRADSAIRARGPMARSNWPRFGRSVDGLGQRQPPLSGRGTGANMRPLRHRFTRTGCGRATRRPALPAFVEPPAQCSVVHPHESRDVRRDPRLPRQLGGQRVTAFCAAISTAIPRSPPMARAMARWRIISAT